MASPNPCAAADCSHAVPAVPASSTGILPPDAVREILLRVPAKDLCRLRAACRPWRSLLSDPRFIAAHAARHPVPLIVAGNPGRGILCDIMDLSGSVVKRIRAAASAETEREWVMSSHLDLICVAKGAGRNCRLLNPATGSVHALPEGFAEEHADVEHQWDIWDYRAVVTFGWVASTGEYKVLRVLRTISTSSRCMKSSLLVAAAKLSGGGRTLLQILGDCTSGDMWSSMGLFTSPWRSWI